MLNSGRFLLHCIQILAIPGAIAAPPLFDSHIHYNADDAALLNPTQVIEHLKRNGIRRALVTSTPFEVVLKLYDQAPDRIIPILGIYRDDQDKRSWYQDKSLPARIEARLNKGVWRGIGELHLFAKHRHSPVFLQIVRLALQRRLPLLIHGDPAVIDSVYDIDPGQTVIWSHAGTYPYPDLIADYLQRYPALYVDLSVRDHRIAPNGKLEDNWFELFLRFPDRFMTGVDTYSPERWRKFDMVVASIRNWLNQLPDDVAMQIRYNNAARLFSIKTRSAGTRPISK